MFRQLNHAGPRSVGTSDTVNIQSAAKRRTVLQKRFSPWRSHVETDHDQIANGKVQRPASVPRPKKGSPRRQKQKDDKVVSARRSTMRRPQTVSTP